MVPLIARGMPQPAHIGEGEVFTLTYYWIRMSYIIILYCFVIKFKRGLLFFYCMCMCVC